jgi:hypothetical protein
VKRKISTLKGRDGYDDDVQAKLSRTIFQRSEKTFLWVALVFKELDAMDQDLNYVHGSYALGIIQQMPSDLSELYSHMMGRINAGIKEDPKYCKQALVVTVLARRPLSLHELAVLAKLPSDMSTEGITAKCGSFLTINKDTVYIFHQSAKDYLNQNFEADLQLNGVAQGHADISIR